MSLDNSDSGQLKLPVRERPLFLLIDGYSLLFRAYYSMGEMNAPDGTPTGALFGLSNMLIKAVGDFKPDYLLVAFDAHGPTFRHESFPEYKANRDAAPEDLKIQLEMSRELVDALGMDHEELLGFEADDVIGTLARKSESKGWDVRILTGDSDLGQLVTERIIVYQSVRGGGQDRVMNIEAVCEKYGIKTPLNLTDYKGLVGDSSDNIPGVRGVGEKTAMKLLAKYPTIEEIYENLDQIEEKFKKRLEPGRDMAFKSKDLATIRIDLPLELDEKSQEEFRYDLEHIDKKKAAELFARLGFRKLADKLELPEHVEEGPSVHEFETVIIDTEEQLEELIGKISVTGRFALDFETSGLDARTESMVGIACALDDTMGYYIPVGHSPSITDEFKIQIPLKKVLEAFKPVWENPEIEKICQHGKFEWLVCNRYGIELKGIVDDPMIADYLIDPDNRHGLKEMAQRELSWTMTGIEDLIDAKGKDQKSMVDVPIDRVAPYAAADAVSTLMLAKIYRPWIRDDGMEELYRKVEIPLEPVLGGMEAIGIRLNPDVLVDLADDLDRKMADISSVIYQEIGDEINLNSPKQLAEVFFDKLEYKKYRGRSTSADVLEKLSEEHELPTMVLEYRSLAKIRGTYTRNLIELIDPDDGRIHTSYNQTVTATGRLSSSNPNLQNIPIRTEIGRGIRKAFEPNNDGDLLLSADYSQIELRLLAHFSKDEVLMEAFQKDEDIHRRTAKEIFGVDADDVTPDMRRGAKTINFGIIYGMGPDGLSKALKKSRSECREFIDRFFERYPGVKSYMQSNIDHGRKHGYVKTLLGRRKYYPELKSDNRMKRAAAERAAINMPLQGSAADIIKLAMVKLHSELMDRGLRKCILLQVHDELVLTVPESRLEEISELVGNSMAGVSNLNAPLIVNCKAGINWLEMESTGDYRSG
ncbi:DNA polymerase I [bacterium]|nr:DNA polymerase I [bacterium]